jgi:hypothetical protein
MDLNDLLAQLATAKPSGNDLNPLAFAHSGRYTDLQDFVIGLAAKRQPLDINPANLCVEGLVRHDSFDDYLSEKALGSSTLKEILKTPLHFYCVQHEPVARKTSSAFELGTFCHMAFLEPQRFDLCVVEPQASRSTTEGLNKLVKFWEKQARIQQQGTGRSIISRARSHVKRGGLSLEKADGKKRYLAALERYSGLTAVDERHYRIIQLVKRHYRTYGGGLLPKLLKGACYETSFYGTDPQTGLKVKVRPDAFQLEENCGHNVIISLKTTSADSVEQFVRDCARYRYDLSEAMYLDVASHVTGRRFSGVITIALQTCAPFLPMAFWWDAESLAAGHYRYRAALQAAADCIESGKYPGFDAFAEEGHMGLISLDLPNWAKTELPSISVEN